MAYGGRMKVLIKSLPAKQFEKLRQLAIDISNASSHKIETVVEAMEIDLEYSDFVDTLCRWAAIAKRAKERKVKDAE
jgi:hypothetical protein